MPCAERALVSCVCMCMCERGGGGGGEGRGWKGGGVTWPSANRDDSNDDKYL